MGQPSMGVATQAALDTSAGYSSASQRFSFVNCTVGVEQEILDGSAAGIRGTRSRQSERTRLGRRHVGGQITLQPSVNELNIWLQYIMGGNPLVGTPAGKTTFPLVEQLPVFFLEVDKVMKVPSYSSGVVTRAVFRASEGELLTMTLDCQFADEVQNVANSFQGTTLPTDGPLVFMDASSITYNSQSYQAKDFELVIDNISNTERFLMSTTRANIPQFDRVVSLRVTVPYTSTEVGLYPAVSAGTSLNAGSADLTFTNGAQSCDFNFPGTIQFVPRAPVIGGKDEILLPLEGIARRTLTSGTGGQPELSVILKLS